jgi:hypothetical protein
MAFGFPAYTEQTARFRGVLRKDLSRAAFDALDELGWHPQEDGRDRICASVPNEFQGIMMTWGAKVFVEIDDEELFIRSEGSIAIAWLDFGQHARNIRRFLERLEDILDDAEAEA